MTLKSDLQALSGVDEISRDVMIPGRFCTSCCWSFTEVVCNSCTWLPLLWNCSSVFGLVSRVGSLFPVCWYAVESETLHSYRQVSFQFCSGWIHHKMEKLWILMKKCMLGLWNTKWMLTILLVCFSPLQILLSLCRERQVTLIGILAQMEQLHLIQLMPT